MWSRLPDDEQLDGDAEDRLQGAEAADPQEEVVNGRRQLWVTPVQVLILVI